MKRIRLASGQSQRELAAKLDVNQTYLSHLENDRRDPSVRFLRRFAKVSDVPVMTLIAVALWAELDDSERRAFAPLMDSLTGLAAGSSRRTRA